MDRLLELYQLRFGQAVKRQGNGWNGPCPLCGGEPGKSDRFMVWPDRDDHLGEVCAEHDIKGIWSCRKCGASGDTISYLVKVDGLSFKEALGELGIEGGHKSYRRRRATELPPAPKAWEPKEIAPATSIWASAALKLVESGERHLPEYPQASKWLAARGLDEAGVATYRIGWLPPESDKHQGRFRPRATFGLESKTGKDGKVRTKLFIPRGIVIPSFDATGRVANVRIRRHKEDLREGFPKYMELEGSQRGPLVLAGSAPSHLAAWFIVEAELDAMLIHHASGGVVGAIAVRTNRGKPDPRTHQLLLSAARILVALDYDQAGAEGVDFWEETYQRSMRWPVPEGKDPGDAFALGVDIREWIAQSLPGCLELPSNSIDLRRASISQGTIEGQAFAENGQMGSSLAGSDNLGGGGKPETNMEKASENIDSHSDQEANTPRMARKGDFNSYDYGDLCRALEVSGRSLAEIPLDVARLYLLWRNIPAVWDKSKAWFIRSVPYYDNWRRDLNILDDLRWDSAAVRSWLDSHPADKITPHNFFRI